MSIGVFISHSTWPKPDLEQRLQDLVPSHSAFRQKLRARLDREPNIDVRIDDLIPTGRVWREFLFESIAECQAAIVLVNEQALHHSPWVDTEVKVLGYRAHNEKDDFCLIVVPFGGITGQDIVTHSAWDPVSVGELQMVPRHGLDLADAAAVDEVIEQIVDILNRLPDHSRVRSHSGWLVARLCALLQLEGRDLRDLGSRLGVDTTRIHNASVVRRRVAHTLYSKGPSGLLQLLGYPGCRLPVGDLVRILEILGTHWIDMSASVGVLSCCRESEAQRVIAINGKEFSHTPRAYVRQVCGLVNPWPLFSVDPRGDVVEQIRMHLTSLFMKRLRCRFPRIELAARDDVTRELNRILSLKQSVPVFVTFLQEGGGQVDDLIETVHAEFPDIRLVVCTGTEPNHAVLAPGIPMLTPEISLEREAREYDAYIGAETHLPDEN